MHIMVGLVAVLLAAPPIKSVEELPKLLQEEFDLLESLDKLDHDRHEQATRLTENQRQRTEVIKRRDEAAIRHQKAQQKLKLERERIRRRIRVYLELKKIKQWQIVASTGDYATYLRKRRLLERMLEDDETRIKRYHKTVKQYRDAETTLANELQELEDVEKRISEARTTVERDKAIKAALLDSVRSEKAFYNKANRDLSKAAKALQEKINRYEIWKGKRLWFREQKGQYMYPLPGGKIARGYGKKTHPRFGTVTMHRGLEFVPGVNKWGRRSKNRIVRAIYWGKAVHVGWLRGYGNTIILDHSRGDYTLYAHLSKMNVKQGDIVQSRQDIGRLGGTGALRGERLYFELRIGGKPKNPSRWFH